MDLAGNAEKILWTGLDFVTHRPRRFFERRVSEPGRYLGPMEALVVSFIAYEASLFAVVSIAANYWSWQTVLGSSMYAKLPADPKLLTVAVGTMSVFTLVLTALLLKLGARLVKRQLPTEAAIRGLAYSTLGNLVLIAYLGFALIVLLFAGGASKESDAMTALGRSLLGGMNLVAFVNVFVYTIPSVAVCAGISTKRLVGGYFLASLVIGAVLGVALMVAGFAWVLSHGIPA